MTKLTPTPEQAEIIGHAKSPESLMITAYAGAAKTTTLELASHKVRSPGLALAFNKAIAQEMEKRFSSAFKCQTMNSLGMAAWAKANPNISLTIDGKKLGKITTQVAKDWKIELGATGWVDVQDVVRRAMLAGIAPHGKGDKGSENALTPDRHEEWLALADAVYVAPEAQETTVEIAREVLLRSNALSRSGTISFDDQIYCPTILGGKWPQFEIVFCDEAQDLNLLNHRMLSLVARPEAKLVIVGDPKQSIYGFRGSHTHSMAEIGKLRSSWINLPLATTFRCPKVIVARQQRHAPGFVAAEGNPEGQFVKLPIKDEFETALDEWPCGASWNFADLVELRGIDESKSMAILCRNNGPLLSLAFRLLRKGIGVRMNGRDIGKNLVNLAKKIGKSNDSVSIFLGKLLDWEESEIGLALANQNDEKIAGIRDRAECLRAVSQGSQARDCAGVCKALEMLFAREEGLVTLSSIHRAKGLEYDLVCHLDPWRVPSKQAKLRAKLGDKSQLQQEYNLQYVCDTRTKHTLVHANLEDFEL